jgi:hypothetical protein
MKSRGSVAMGLWCACLRVGDRTADIHDAACVRRMHGTLHGVRRALLYSQIPVHNKRSKNIHGEAIAI